jgi:imidazolonepropionase-like amidohydrolase
MKDMTVVIEGDKIAELKPGTYKQAAGEGERVFDLEGGYVLPGLWNVHAHQFELFEPTKHLILSESVPDCTIRGGRNLMDALRLGITGVRVVGESDFNDVSWKRAFDTGLFLGPRMFVAGYEIGTTGGHGAGWPNFVGGPRGGVDGPYEMRKAVREQLKRGADWIKLDITGHVFVNADGERMIELEVFPDEVKAATEVAHQKGKKVCAHDESPEGVKLAIQCGVDCIEHGTYMDDECIEMMVENDVWYVPTIRCSQDLKFKRENGASESEINSPKRVAERKAHLEVFQKALKAGLKMAAGGDSTPIGELGLREIEHLVKAGMPEMEALIAATRNSADLCGVVDRLGTVEVGKLADLIAVAGDPLEDISNIRKLKLVLRGGNLVDLEPEGLVDFWELYLH